MALGINGRSHFGDSGEREGKLVRDLSEIDEAELDMYEAYLRGFTLTVCDRELFPEALEWVEEVLCKEEADPASIVPPSQVSQSLKSCQQSY
jgi:hypothetical protein